MEQSLFFLNSNPRVEQGFAQAKAAALRLDVKCSFVSAFPVELSGFGTLNNYAGKSNNWMAAGT